MIKQDFLELVFNYEQSKDWDFQGNLPCLIDFHDDDCPPCLSMAPVLEKLALKYQEKVDFYKVDAKKDDILAQELGIINLPTLVLCPAGDKPVVIQGAIGEDKLIEKIEKELLAFK